MKILFSMRHPGLVRNFETMLCGLAERGHDVRVVSDQHGTPGDRDLRRALSARWPSLVFSPGPCDKSAARHAEPFIWSDLAHRTRAALDYLHYQQPAFDRAMGLRARSEKRTPSSVVGASRLPIAKGRNGVRVLEAAIGTMERAMPWNREVERFLARHRPDALLVSPLIWFGSPQADYVRAARALGIRSVWCVASWDNLTTKGAIYELPDLVAVWNETQKAELVDLHGVPAARIVVTGAHTYDHWFDWPARPRQEFCDRIGLAADRPFVLYACSSRSVSPFEATFIQSWLARVRASDRPALRLAGILIRPHPENPQPWHDLGARDAVVVWPRAGANPQSPADKADYFDSLYHSAAVVGVNTSAFIEAGIVGRPVLSLLSPEFADAQERTIHFQSLAIANGGIVRTARDIDSHLDHVASALAPATTVPSANQTFIGTFVRPLGADRPATPHLVAAIERLGQATRPRPARRWHWAHVIRPALFPLAIRSAAAAFKARQGANGRPISSSSAYRRVLFHPTAGRFRLRRVRVLGARALDGIFRSSAIRHFTRTHLAPRATSQLPQEVTTTEPVGAAPGTVLPAADASRRVERALRDSLVGDARRTPRLTDDASVLAGPFLGEVGFELLYWIPFLRWATAITGLDPQRLIVVSRGGTAAWYHGLCGSYYDVFDDYAPEECFRRNIEQAGRFQKQMDLGDFDRELIERVQRTRGLADVRTLHPSLMYQAFTPFWRKQASIRLLESMTTYQVLSSQSTGATTPDLAGVHSLLPDDYVAVKFYGNDSFPNLAANRAMVEDIVSRLTERTHVVLLETGLRVDDHLSFAVADRPRLTRIDRAITPRNNLALQTAIIRGARAFVGTFGGFSFLAAFCGVDSVALYSHPELFRAHHLDVAWRVFRSLDGGAFVPLDTAHVDVLGDVLKRTPRPVADGGSIDSARNSRVASS